MDSTTNTVYYDLKSAVKQLSDSVADRAKTDLCIDIDMCKSFVVVTAVRANEKLIAICSRNESYEFASKNDVRYEYSVDEVLKYRTNLESKTTSVNDIIRRFSYSRTNVIISIYEFADKRLKLTDRYVEIEGKGVPSTQLGDIIILSE